GSTRITFGVDANTFKALEKGRCLLYFPTGSQLALNRNALPEGSPDFSILPCGKARNLLAFVFSSKGQSPTLPLDNHDVSLWQLVGDPSFPGKTLSGFGRFALFRVLGATPGARLRLTLTTSPLVLASGSRRLPPAAVVGGTRKPLPLVGSGSARVFSAPV